MDKFLETICDDSQKDCKAQTKAALSSNEFIATRGAQRRVSDSHVVDVSAEEYLDESRKLESKIEASVEGAVQEAEGLTESAQELYDQVQETVQEKTESFVTSLVEEITSVLPDVATEQAQVHAQEEVEQTLDEQEGEQVGEDTAQTDEQDANSDLLNEEYEVNVGDSVYAPSLKGIYKVKAVKDSAVVVDFACGDEVLEAQLKKPAYKVYAPKVADSAEEQLTIHTSPIATSITAGSEVFVEVEGELAKRVVADLDGDRITIVNEESLETENVSPNVVWEGPEVKEPEAPAETVAEPTEGETTVEVDEFEEVETANPEAVAEAESILYSAQVPDSAVTDAKLPAPLLNVVKAGMVAPVKYKITEVNVDKGPLGMGKYGLEIVFDKKVSKEQRPMIKKMLEDAYAKKGYNIEVNFPMMESNKCKAVAGKGGIGSGPATAQSKASLADSVEEEMEVEEIARAVATQVGYWVTTNSEELATNTDPQVHIDLFRNLFDELSPLDDNFTEVEDASAVNYGSAEFIKEDNGALKVGNTVFLYQTGAGVEPLAAQVAEVASSYYISLANQRRVEDSDNDLLSESAKDEIVSKVEEAVKVRLSEAGITVEDSTTDYAAALAEAEKNTETEISEEQKASGDYQKGIFNYKDKLEIAIENPKGSIRSGVSPDGRKWENEMKHTYGFFTSTQGPDNDEVDCYIGPNLESEEVFVIDQRNADGSFDEYKVMLGFDSSEEARAAYLSNYEEGWQGLGDITHTDLDTLKRWLEAVDRRDKPFIEYLQVTDAMDPNEDRDEYIYLNWSLDKLKEYHDKIKKRSLKKSDRKYFGISDSEDELSEAEYTEMEGKVEDCIASKSLPAPKAEVHSAGRNSYDVAHSPTTFATIRDSATALKSHLAQAAKVTDSQQLTIEDYRKTAEKTPDSPYVRAVADSALTFGDLDLFSPYLYKRKLSDSFWVSPSASHVEDAFQCSIPAQYKDSSCLVSTTPLDQVQTRGLVYDSVLEFDYAEGHKLYVAPLKD